MKKISETMVKNAEKINLSEMLKEFFKDKGITYYDGELYGFPKNSIVVQGVQSDIQLKLVVPKKGIYRYEQDKEKKEETKKLDVQEILKIGVTDKKSK